MDPIGRSDPDLVNSKLILEDQGILKQRGGGTPSWDTMQSRDYSAFEAK
jgi:hypothetical protein